MNATLQQSGNERLSYSPEEAASLTGVSRAFLYLEMQRGKLASIKIGRRRLIRRADLLAWMGEARHAAD